MQELELQYGGHLFFQPGISCNLSRGLRYVV